MVCSRQGRVEVVPMTSSQRLHERCGCAGGGRRAPFSLAGTERQYERDRPFRITHLFVDLELDFEEKAVRGRAVLDFERSGPTGDELDVDAVGFELESVRVDAGEGFRPFEYAYDSETIRLRGIPERGKLRIDYRAKPKRGLYFLSPDEQL